MRRTACLMRTLGLCLLLAACSTTRNLPEGEVLYTGQKSMIVHNPPASAVGETAMEEVEAALATAPNNALLGSSTIRIPFPLGLWVYNGFVKYKDKKGLGHWIFNRFAADPVLLSGVNPEIRQKAAMSIMRDYGYFNGAVGFQTFYSPDSLKAKLQYTVDFRQPYVIDTLAYRGFSSRTLRILQLSRRRSLVRPGTQFNVTSLDEERTRVSNLLRNVGCYYFRPDYLTYQADTTLVPGGHVAMRMIPVPGMPPAAERPFHVGRSSFHLYGRNGELPNDSTTYNGLKIYYHDKLRVRPNRIYHWLDYQGYRRKRQVEDSTGIARHRSAQNLYSAYRQSRIQNRLSNLGIFRYTEMRYTPRDTAMLSDTLDVQVIAMLDKPYDAELDFNVKMKSNNQTGPGAAFTLTRNNVFGGGETWNVKLEGSYEWQTGSSSSSKLNSYEIGVSSSLTFPRVMLPRIGGGEYDFPATTTFRLYLDQLNRARYYRLLAFGGNVTYDFQPKPTGKHSFTPFRLTFNVLRNPTPEFQALQEENPALYVSLRDQFIPAMEYTYTYDNSSLHSRGNLMWWQTTLASAGNFTSVIYRLFGEPFNKTDKELLGVPFAQYAKLNTEFRYHFRIDKNQTLATRVAAGIICSYGNARTAPYTEQFYIGGANSVRAFAARNVGPGGYPADEDSKYSFINHVGDIRLEANVEYRFRIISDLHGAVFLDAGNVWLMRKDEARPGGELTLKHFLDQVALGTGFGLRYDLDFLVFRLDCGIGLHDPYDTGKSGYYNIPRFKDGLAVHFAIGYPF